MPHRSGSRSWPAVASLLIALAGAGVEAQTPPPAQAPDSVVIVPGAQYRRSALYRFLFGERYRDLWTTPIKVPTLHLGTYAGGLRPTTQGGNLQTLSLRFHGADGREYVFRSIDKDASRVLSEDLQETFVGRVFQDQISAIHPSGALVVPPIMRAAQVLHAEPMLVVMPNDPALGEHRARFANRVGTLEERPRGSDDHSVSFGGAQEIVSSASLLKRLDQDPTIRVDARALLLARLTDVFLGDWDRHADQWRWALIADTAGARWLPIPRDRDYVFARFDGLVLSILRQWTPQLVNFGPEYSSMVGATWNGRDLDRRLLTELERSTWDSVATVLQERVTDAVIDDAVRRLPPELKPLSSAGLAAVLKERREGILAMARRYYRQLARDVDIYASDRADRVRVIRMDDRTVEVSVTCEDAPDAPYYRRRFIDGETGSVRIYLGGGDDKATIAGEGSAGIDVRLIGGKGNDRFADSARVRQSSFYDESGNNRSAGERIDTKPYVARTTTAGVVPRGGGRATSWGPLHRDWGSMTILLPTFYAGPDVGVLFGISGNTSAFGFRKRPYAHQERYQLGISTGAATVRAALGLRVQRENSSFFADIEARASGIEVLRWHGFGNETALRPGAPPSFYRVTQNLFSLQPQVGWRLAGRSEVSVGPYVSYSMTDLDNGTNAGRFIAADRPYGTGNYAIVGARATLLVDLRDTPAAARRGVAVQVSATMQPAALDVEKAYGSIEGEVATYFTARIPTTPTLALHGGGKKIWGTAGRIPFHDAASLGSASTLRGFHTDRFVGDASLYGSAELRLHLTNIEMLVPGQQGVFAFYDVGRVYLEGETSDQWHEGFGGGVWLSFLTRTAAVTGAIGHSDEGTRVYLRAGFAF